MFTILLNNFLKYIYISCIIIQIKTYIIILIEIKYIASLNYDIKVIYIFNLI